MVTKVWTNLAEKPCFRSLRMMHSFYYYRPTLVAFWYFVMSLQAVPMTASFKIFMQ